MAIDCALHGFLAGDADARVSKNGKSWVRLRVGVGKDDDVQWVSVAVFGKAAEGAAALKKSNRVYIEGQIRIDTWTGNDGIERHGLSVAAYRCEQTHRIGRAKPKRGRHAGGDDQHGDQHEHQTAPTTDEPNDPLPF
jgi:single-strand DNA-binding protein